MALQNVKNNFIGGRASCYAEAIASWHKLETFRIETQRPCYETLSILNSYVLITRCYLIFYNSTAWRVLPAVSFILTHWKCMLDLPHSQCSCWDEVFCEVPCETLQDTFSVTWQATLKKRKKSLLNIYFWLINCYSREKK